MRKPELSPWSVVGRILDGSIGGMLIAAIIISTFDPHNAAYVLDFGIFLGSLIGFLSTIGSGT